MTTTPKTIWDLPTRITHWALAFGVILNLFVVESGDEAHRWIGYVTVALIAFRVIWGFVGAPASRFRSFPVSPKKIWAFLKSGLNNNYQGHNPLASLAYILIWLNVISLGITGYMMGLDAYFGEEWLESLHGNIATALQILIGIHLLGVFSDSLRYKRKTWAAMLTGRKS